MERLVNTNIVKVNTLISEIIVAANNKKNF